MRKCSSVAVVGAGLAGLACAERLQQAGRHVAVFDKSRGPSGRMSTRRGDDWQCDHGAQYWTARSPAFQAEVARWLAAGVAAPWSPRCWVVGDRPGHLAPADAEASLVRYVGTPRMTAPARFLTENLGLTVQHTVSALHAVDDGWQLETQEHGRLATHYDAVVLAVPAPQAVPLLKPVASTLAEQAQAARMRGCWTLMLRFPAPLPCTFEAAFINEGPLRWIARDSSKPGRPAGEVWVAQAEANWSEAHLEETSEQILASLLPVFQGLTGAPGPSGATAHRWRYADTEPALSMGCVWDAAQGLGLCGDWLNGGKVEGAWLSGRALAEQLLASPR